MSGVSAERMLRAATIDDVDGVEALLRDAQLPPEGLRDQFPAWYWVAIANGHVMGSVGIERYAEFGLLRSLAVAHALRGQALGQALLNAALRRARDERLQGVFLLTTTAKDFFLKQGFSSIERASVPAPVQASKEFASICPSSASCLVWHAG